VIPIAIRHPQAVALYRLALFTRGIARRLMAAARQLDQRLEARAAGAAALRDLAAMSDYELRDIGLRRWDVDSVAKGGSPRSVDHPR